MPCYQPDAIDLANAEREAELEWNVRLMTEDYNNLVRITCAACKEMEKSGIEIPTDELKSWWSIHQKSAGHEK